MFDVRTIPPPPPPLPSDEPDIDFGRLKACTSPKEFMELVGDEFLVMTDLPTIRKLTAHLTTSPAEKCPKEIIQRRRQLRPTVLARVKRAKTEKSQRARDDALRAIAADLSSIPELAMHVPVSTLALIRRAIDVMQQ